MSGIRFAFKAIEAIVSNRMGTIDTYPPEITTRNHIETLEFAEESPTLLV